MNQQCRQLVTALVAIGIAWSAAASNALAHGGGGKPCSNATLHGTYGIQMQGTRGVPGGGTESVIGVVVRNYDGQGGVTQVDNIKGSITGIVPDRPGAGTYEVNEDCSAVVEFEPAPGILIRETMVIVDKGRELRSITSFPPAVMVTSVQIRM
jgi:hypothetical protein